LPREGALQRLFSAFPAGRPGVGLLALRAAVGASAVVHGVTRFDAEPTVAGVAAGLTLVAGGLCLLAGFLTPVAAVAVSVSAAGLAFSWLPLPPSSTVVASPLAAVAALALALLGPGAYSLDSRLFGRREIVLTAGTLKRDTQS
jgi:uncharacterized membrane protein YphA (DoxX/SURF4 family)